MARIPAASPSRPSMKFVALAIPITHNTVISADQSGESTRKPAKGTRKYTMLTPVKDSTPPARTIPASFAGAEISIRSSMQPTAYIRIAAPMMPRIGPCWAKTGSNPPLPHATSIATRKPANMAIPPKVGVGRSWIRRSSGAATAPTRTASQFTDGTSSQVVNAAASPTTT